MFRDFKKKLSLYSWACYDFANTIFSAVVLTFYFPLYLTNLTQKNVYLGISTTTAMVLAGIVVPWLGSLSDRTGKTKACLIQTTLLCIAFVISLSLAAKVPLLIVCFLWACFFYHASLVFYNALLPVVAEPQSQGMASGIGTALGYLGVLFAIPIADRVDHFFGRRFVFLVAGILFLIFSLPLFLWVPERKAANPAPFSLRLFFPEWRKVFQTAASLKQNRTLGFFFLGNYFVVEALNTVIFWFVVYLAHVFHPPQSLLVAIFLMLNFSAFVFGFVAGFLTDRWGAQRTLVLAAASLFGTLLLLGLTKSFLIFTGLSFTGGAFSLAAMWTAGRKRLVELSPPESVGEYFGLYNLTTKISVASSLVFSILADRWGYPTALLSLLLPSGLGLFFLTRRSASRCLS